MTFIQIEFDIEADCARVWQVIGDWATGPMRMAPGFVASSEATGDVRIVTFADGFVARERLVSRDDSVRRIAYSLIGDTARPEHDNAVMQVASAGPRRCRFLWSRDVLPDAAAGPLRAAMQEAAPIIKSALENSTVG
ncbi:MxaD family protein [Mycobacterium sp. CBMA 234]|uniref:SRPBCC family protein n=1 Tax=Mycolicibacterium sp. CBMA 234 TaxID=1918495 RepID=UPI0012DE43F5|nr:SRPBCC family protein [Mycolicibacterium sp. CBMA 234]MUL63599.1 MxaD family protein [Mycolicibacterium sp. CBMA 234]